ncbi:ORF1347 [White spot syndrome virus]|uniref:ORF1347 n=1 Tax=White spot syndrome virus TaxID=342409 RepID=A0A2D3I6B5_9VIRU|nr:ORF1347 [White spot syndrome virus]
MKKCTRKLVTVSRTLIIIVPTKCRTVKMMMMMMTMTVKAWMFVMKHQKGKRSTKNLYTQSTLQSQQSLAITSLKCF